MEEIYHIISDLLGQGKKMTLATVLRVQGSAPRGPSAKMVITDDGKIFGTIGGGCIESYVIAEARKLLNGGPVKVIECDLGDDSWSGVGMACGGKVEIALEFIEPSPQLVILGAGHIAGALCGLAVQVGFRVSIVDPFADELRFPQAELVIRDSIRSGFQRLKIRPSDFIIIVTRHHADGEALKAALSSSAGYVGMIGSKNRVKNVYSELIREGVIREELARVHAPIGLDIGGETPEEIAVSILAEIIMTKRGGTGKSMAVGIDICLQNK